MIFFVVPMVVMLSLSLQEGDVVNGFVSVHLALADLRATRWQHYQTQFIRSVGVRPGRDRSLQIVLAYPIAYWIAFYGGSRKSTYLFLLLLPFFVSFVLRTVSWKFILADEGIVLGAAEGRSACCRRTSTSWRPRPR